MAAIEPKFWGNLCRALGVERWIDAQLDDAVQEQVRADVAAAFATRPRDEWVAELAPGDTCVAPVLSVAELVDHPQFVARGDFAEAVHPTEGRFRQVAPTLAGTVRPEGAVAVPDLAATDTDELLAAAGFGSGRCAELRAAGVVA